MDRTEQGTKELVWILSREHYRGLLVNTSSVWQWRDGSGIEKTEARNELDWGTLRWAGEAIGGETLTHVEWSNG
jgi:hypothetical protein